MLFTNCDDTRGASGSADFLTKEKTPQIVAIQRGISAGGWDYPYVGERHLPDTKENWGRYPNVSIRISSPYFESHRNIHMSDISDIEYRSRKYQCIRAREKNDYPAFWLIADAVHDYHGQLSARQIASCPR